MFITSVTSPASTPARFKLVLDWLPLHVSGKRKTEQKFREKLERLILGLWFSESPGPGSVGGFSDVIWIINDSGFLNSFSTKSRIRSDSTAYDTVLCVPPLTPHCIKCWSRWHRSLKVFGFHLRTWECPWRNTNWRKVVRFVLLKDCFLSRGRGQN